MIFFPLSHPFCVVCMFTHMIRFRRKCLVIVLLNKHVLQSRSHVRCCFRRTGQALTICITTLFSSRLRVNYDYITNLFKRCKPLCLGSLSYLLSSLLRFNLIFGYFFLTYSCSTLACLLFLLSCVSLGEGLTEVTFFLLLTLED